MVFTLVGCNKDEESTVVNNEPVVQESEIVGGYIKVEEGTLAELARTTTSIIIYLDL